MVSISGHTIDETLLSNGVVIDVGCRDFTFATHEVFKSNKVYSLDIDSEVFLNGAPSGITGINIGLSDKSGDITYYRNGESTVMLDADPDKAHKQVEGKVITLKELYDITGKNIDLLKLDCEGAEYFIINELFEPIPKQISIEFHHHCNKELHDKNIDRVLAILDKNYYICHNNNYFDTLFIRK